MFKAKVVSVVIVFIMALGVLAGCGSSQSNTKPASVVQSTELKVFQGVGQVPGFRVGPGKDKKDVQVYSLTYLTANGLFDKDGKILNIYFDALEISSPNYDGESMPHFSGWPDTQGYNVTDHKTGEVSGVSQNTKENIAAEVNGWKSKRERGDKYGMNYANDWHKQADFYQNFFKGKTIVEIEEWFAKNTSDVNARPLKAVSKDEKDIAKFAKLNDKEKAALADVVTGATMSLKDAHGDFIAAIKKAYANRLEITLPTK